MDDADKAQNDYLTLKWMTFAGMNVPRDKKNQKALDLLADKVKELRAETIKENRRKGKRKKK